MFQSGFGGLNLLCDPREFDETIRAREDLAKQRALALSAKTNLLVRRLFRSFDRDLLDNEDFEDLRGRAEASVVLDCIGPTSETE